mmetsp:Transcript_27637/g.66411  ORF Transcript_27637/g.66411 Transcript_27637/m.66411 type:complete len:192 (-) Transcript_27637:2433-3008(-)
MTPSERIDWIVRPATLEDKTAVDELLVNSYTNLLPANYDVNFLKTVLPLITKAQEELLTCGTWYVVEDPSLDGTLVGCGGFTSRNPSTQTKKEDRGAGGTMLLVPHLRHFATRPDMSRKGVGKAIWNRSWEDIAKQSPTGTNTSLEVFSTLTAEAFYASVGFRKVNHVIVPISEDCDFPCILMRRDPVTSS